ncbi:hypothetical protein ABBQ38_006412 [Trebouxia sp. C0009 RCD-2024]
MDVQYLKPCPIPETLCKLLEPWTLKTALFVAAFTPMDVQYLKPCPIPETLCKLLEPVQYLKPCPIPETLCKLLEPWTLKTALFVAAFTPMDGSSAVHDAKLAAQAVCSAKPTGVTAQTSKAVFCLPHSQSSTGARGMHWVLGSSAVRYA